MGWSALVVVKNRSAAPSFHGGQSYRKVLPTNYMGCEAGYSSVATLPEEDVILKSSGMIGKCRSDGPWCDQ